MKFRIGHEEFAPEAIVFPIFAESLSELPRLHELLGQVKLAPGMGSRHSLTWFHGRSGEPDVVLVGLGPVAKFGQALLREAAGNAGRALVKERRGNVTVKMEALLAAGVSFEADWLSAWTEGTLLGTYRFDRHKSAKAEERFELDVRFACEETEEWLQAVRLGEIRADATMWARDLTNEPPNILRPGDLAERVKERFAGSAAAVTVYQGEELERMGFAGVAAVGKGSAYPPAFLELRYCTDNTLPLTALIGKGVTFDTGGISLKKDNDISDMRMDMAGASAVLAALDIAVRSGTAANVAVLVPACENSPGGRAMLPGELIRYANGVTVHVGNTDSEGRLILADALVYAHKLGAAVAVDMATLTYSVVGALGSVMAGILGDDGLVRELQTAGAPFGERTWQLPLVDEYESYLDSDYADACNISRVGEAGAITAALFLRKFVHPDLKWAHIDMNGPKDTSSAKGEFAVGATGYGARMLAQFLAGQAR